MGHREKLMKAFNEASKKRKAERRTAKRRIIITDQGNGGQFCGNCLTETTYKDKSCPACGFTLINDDSIGGDFGNRDPNRY